MRPQAPRFGALNTMCGYRGQRLRAMEIATLRAIGFSARHRGSVCAGVESLLPGNLWSGAFIGAIAAWMAFNGNFHAVGGLVV